MAKSKYNKFNTQTPADFALTVYGTTSTIFDFMEEAGYTEYSDFINDSRKTIELEDVPNEIANQYTAKNIVVSTIQPEDYAAQLTCNNDLTSKTLVIGDFNDDYNNDFSTTELVDVVVGYEGMTLYLIWSVTNAGNKVGTATGTLQLTGFADRPFSADVPPETTYTFTEIYEAVPQGILTANITGQCPQSLVMEVLGAPAFVYNDDLAIVELEPIVQGDTVTVRWSVSNNGTANAPYESILDVTDPNGVKTTYTFNEIIDVAETQIFSQQVAVIEGTYVFEISEPDTLSLTVQAPVLVPNIVYNNDLLVSNATPTEGDTITVTWSLTNNGGASGTLNGLLTATPSVIEIKHTWQDIVAQNPITIAPAQTIVFTKQLLVSTDTITTIAISGSASDSTAITVTPLVPVGDLVFEGFWLGLTFQPEETAPTPYVPLVVTPNTVVYSRVRYTNNGATADTVNIKMRYDGVYTFRNYDKTIEAGETSITSHGIGTNTPGGHYIEAWTDGVYRGKLTYTVTE